MRNLENICILEPEGGAITQVTGTQASAMYPSDQSSPQRRAKSADHPGQSGIIVPAMPLMTALPR